MDYKNYKWLFISSLQKAIRRGLVEESVILWEKSREIESFYAAYRVAIMAIEDVGLGNQDLVYDFLSTSLKKASVEEKGGEEYLKNVVRGLAGSVKDRSACDITWLAGHHNIGEKTQIELIDIYKNSEILLDRVLAAWLIVGTKKIKHSIYNYDEKNEIESFLKINTELNYNDKAIEVVRASINYHKEPHIFAYPLLQNIFEKEKNANVSIYKTGDALNYNLDTPIYYFNEIPILLSAVDGHTAEGKKVIDKIKQNQSVKNILKNEDSNVKDYLLKHSLFKAEGQCVNKRLIYPTAIKIYKESQNFYQNDSFKINELTEKVKELIPEINQMRIEVLNETFKINKGFKKTN